MFHNSSHCRMIARLLVVFLFRWKIIKILDREKFPTKMRSSVRNDKHIISSYFFLLALNNLLEFLSRREAQTQRLHYMLPSLRSLTKV